MARESKLRLILELTVIALLAFGVFKYYTRDKGPSAEEIAEKKRDRTSAFLRERQRGGEVAHENTDDADQELVEERRAPGLQPEPTAANGLLRLEIVDANGQPVNDVRVFSQHGAFTNQPINGVVEEELIEGPIVLQLARANSDEALLPQPITLVIPPADVLEHRIQLPPTPAAAEPDPPQLFSAGIDVVRGDEWLEITQVAPGSPAAQANIHPGDLIFSINGNLAVELSNEAILEALQGPANTRIQLLLAVRDGTNWAEADIELVLGAP